jgi:hypothetical protein
MEKKIIDQLNYMGCQKAFKEVIAAIGFEKIVNIKIDTENFKAEYSRKEKINTDDVIMFFITDKVAKKASKSDNFDYILTEREISRLARDRKII